LWYTLLIFPLLALRYYFYNKAKYQYFMLDFCYFVQLMLLFSLYALPNSLQYFQIVFALSNGPLALGIVMWRNSLVFHDLDKLTSVFIHIFPPLVTFCLRWYPTRYDILEDCSDCGMSAINAFGYSLVFYTIWQILYFVKTEIADKKKIECDAYSTLPKATY